MNLSTPLWVACAAAAGMVSVPTVTTAGEAVVLYSAGIDGCLDDAKDASLLAALVRMQKNDLSLPPDMAPDEVRAVNMLVDAFLSELDFRLSVQTPSGADAMPFGATLSTRGNAGTSAESLHQQVKTIMSMTGAPKGMPDPSYPGFMAFNGNGSDQTPFWFGTETVGGDVTTIFSVNTPPRVSETDWSGCGVPAGTNPLLGALIDFNEMQPLLAMAAMVEPQAGAMLSQWGLTGPQAMRLEFAAWRAKQSMRYGGRISNYGVHFGDLMVEGGVGVQELGVVPADAVAMQVDRFDLSGMFDFMLSMAGGVVAPDMGGASKETPMSPAEMMLMQAKAMIGINLKTEFIDYLGDALVMYRSRSTGGDGLMSSVLLVKLSNADGMATSLGTLAARLNAMLSPLSQGYAQITTWAQPDCGEAIALTFPGVPVPLELSLVVKDDWLVAALNPQAMVAACRQLDASTSILDNPRFSSSVGSDAIGAVQVSFSDLPAQLDRGYGYAVGLMSAISNYTRPRRNAAADVQMILPPYADLVKDARPCVLIARMSGDDMVYTGSGDSSISVLVTGAAANVTAMAPILVPLAAGMAFPAIAKARERAVEIRDHRMETREHEHDNKEHEE
jgi:hypothetical protein